MVAAGALLLVLALANPAARWVRFALAVVAGAAIAIGFALVFPQCLGRPEQVLPELARDWLDHVREAKPIYEHPLRAAFPIAALPENGRAHVCTPGTNSHLVCRPLLGTQKKQ